MDLASLQDSLHCHTCCLAVKIKHIAIEQGEMLAKNLSSTRAMNRYCLLKVLKFLARQNCGIRGHGDQGEGNLVQLMKRNSENDSKVNLICK